MAAFLKQSCEVLKEARFGQNGKIILKPLKNFFFYWVRLQYLQSFPETITLKYSWTLAQSAYSNEDYSTLFKSQ